LASSASTTALAQLGARRGGGIGALFVALTLGNLARRVTSTGGPDAYARAILL
jgi:hypothetical protein